MKKVFFIVFLFSIISCQNEKEKTKISSDLQRESNDQPDAIENVSRDTIVTFLWRENIYDESIKDSISTIVINKDFCESIHDSEKAALAYIATFIGSECWWDGSMNEDRSNLQCEIHKALNLGYQCSKKHLGIIEKWFSGDKDVLDEIQNCPIIPHTATVQNTFDKIDLNRIGDTIEISFAVTQINTREALSTEYTEKNIFIIQGDQITLHKKEMSEFKKKTMVIGPN